MSEPATACPGLRTSGKGKNTPHLDNLYIASIIAINADTGQLKWHYQCTPGDQWDYDAIQHLMLADIRINNRNRKVIMQANKNGYFYVIDRVNGEFISAGEMSQMSWASGIDPKGRPIINPDAYYSSERGVTVYPVQMHNTSQMSFSPHTGLIYVPIAVEHLQLHRGGNIHAQSGRTESSELRRRPWTRWRRPRCSTADGHTCALRTRSPRRGWQPHAWRHSHRMGSRHSEGTVVRPRRRQTDGGVLSMASNLVIQTRPKGRLEGVHRGQG